MFCWNDVLQYSPEPSIKPEEIIPKAFVIGGEPIEMEAPDKYTLVMKTAAPFTTLFKILTTLLYPYPVHYLKQFHPKYAESDRDPVEMWQEFEDVHAAITNPDLPSYGAWITETVKEGELLTMKRNPYYWKVDPEGRQLPYIDGIRTTYVKDGEVQKLQLAAGLYDFCKWPPVDTVLFQQQKAGNYALPLLDSYYFGPVVQIPWVSKIHEDPDDQKLAELLQNPQFLKALQLGIDNQHVVTAYCTPALAEFLGGVVGHLIVDNSLLVGNKLDDPRVVEMWEFLEDWLRYDPDEANQILDELGLKIGSDGYRHYPDGGRVEIAAGTWSDWQPVGEIGTMVGMEMEKDLKIKFYVSAKTWSDGVQPWYLDGDIPLLFVGAHILPWDADFDVNNLFQRPATNWIASDGAQGLKPHDAMIEPLRKLNELQDEFTQIVDSERKVELAVQAAELIIYNYISYPLMIGYQKQFFYAHNRIVNMPEAFVMYSIWRKAMRQEQWWIKE